MDECIEVALWGRECGERMAPSYCLNIRLSSIWSTEWKNLECFRTRVTNFEPKIICLTEKIEKSDALAK